MTTGEEVKHLAALARIRVTEADIECFVQEFDAILAYVGQLDALEVPIGVEELAPLRNVMREDGEPHAPEMFTERLAAQFPAREGDALVVKQVITHE